MKESIYGIYNRYRKLAAVACLSMALPVLAQTTQQITQSPSSPCGLDVSGVSLKRQSDHMTVGLTFGLGGFDLGGNRAAVFTPMLVNGPDTLALQPVGLYGRTRWYQHLRSGKAPFGGDGATAIRWSERPSAMDYAQTVPYAEWMDGSQLLLHRSDYGCRRRLVAEQHAVLTGYRELKYSPAFRYVRPAVDAAKSRELSGRAFVDFVVNRTEINPSYRNNRV